MYNEDVFSKKMNFPEKVIWDEGKNYLLLATRGVNFDEVKEQIDNNQILDIIANPSVNHSHQYILLFKYNGYIWNCPCLIEKEQMVLKTIFKNRKHNALYL